ncbi:hypothetical protein [Blattabacterium cuenoti]|uniref:hypothetical protein n=1 Tax=Blattabacterium cuenoti TaxID=1653831 RepID=UPI00163C77C9|nr:hypothetical protein [Blattabacterium cuenoti]
MKIKGKKIFEEVIKNGKYLFIHPISSVRLEKINDKKDSSINLIGTLVKKKL